MNIRYQYADGSPVPDNVCMTPSMMVSTVEVKIESMELLSPAAILTYLQKRWGVHVVKIKDVVVTVRNGLPRG